MSTIEKAAARLGNQPAVQTTPDNPTGSGQGLPPLDISPDNLGGNKVAGIQSTAYTPDVVELDIKELIDRGFLSPKSGRSQLAQDLRRIKRPLLLHAQKTAVLESSTHPGNLIMVTSALPGEGKTFISINLAISIAAEMDRRVLLVDGDLAKGDVARQLGIDVDRGLSDILQEANFFSEDGVLTTNIDRLSILPSGKPHEQTDELFASSLMHEIVDRLAKEDPSRIVIFDAPPLLATTEAAVLAGLMGQIVMVVESNNTPQSAVLEGLHQLEQCESVSLLLNKSSKGNLTSYGYGYTDDADSESAVN